MPPHLWYRGRTNTPMDASTPSTVHIVPNSASMPGSLELSATTRRVCDVGVLVFAFLFVGLARPLVNIGSDNERMVSAFETDDALQVNLLSTALKQHTWRIPFGSYGHLLFNFTLVPLKLIQLASRTPSAAAISTDSPGSSRCRVWCCARGEQPRPQDSRSEPSTRVCFCCP
jgi:hypothetical protein